MYSSKIRTGYDNRGRFPVRVGRENMHAMFHFLLIFTFRLKHEPLEDVIIVPDDAAYS